MPDRYLKPLVCVGVSLLLAGCAAGGGDGDFPSLARRPVEGVLTSVQTEPVPPAIVPAGAGLNERLSAWTRASAAADAAFQAALPDVEVRVVAAQGTPAGSDSWFAAQQAVSRLDVLRGPLSRIWADVDALYVSKTVADDAEGAAEIALLHARLAKLAAEQIEQVEALGARIAPR
jgi:hypothetical protein